MALVVHRLAQNDLYFLSHEALKLARLGELALDTGRADFEGVPGAGHHVLHVQDGAHLLRNELAVGVGHPLRLVDKNAQNTTTAAAQQLNIDNFYAFAHPDPFGDFLHFLYDSLSILVRHLAKTSRAIKKWAFAHFGLAN